MSGKKGQERDFEAYPKYRNAYLLAFKKMIESRKQEGKGVDNKWETPESVMKWWLSEWKQPDEQLEGQIALDLEEIQKEMM